MRKGKQKGTNDPSPAAAAWKAADPPDKAYLPKEVPLWNNTLSVVGIFMLAVGLMSMLTFGLFTLVTPGANPYVDIVGYLIVPSVLILGLLCVPLGILSKSWRLHRRDRSQPLVLLFPHFDLNDPAQRRLAKYVVLGTFILLPVVGVSGYHGYHYTDSVGFCAKPCHEVMSPQSTTYEHSAHARVSCAECHIGEGAGWFVKSKLSGTRQVVAVWRDSFPRPIPPAISNLRPARETCERCHWPKKFFGAQLREIMHFSSDEENTRREINMLLKTGGGDETTGRAEGIHLHMALQGRIKYVATDDFLQEIPWVEFTNVDGKRLVYRSDGRPTSDPKPEGQERTLDCMDCHNRPAHKFRSPSEAVDIYLDIGKIDTTLPFIKREATRALTRSYPNVETAHAQIGAALVDFYRKTYPEVWEARKASVNGAIDMVREAYDQNTFPEMRVDWRTYPDNIGHLNSSGCFRCHEGNHVNQYGDRLSHACDVCHTFLNPVNAEGAEALVRDGEFQHSYKLQGVHADTRCDNCHDGGMPPPPDCAGCHVEVTAYRAGTSEIFAEFEIDADAMAANVDCESCHDLSEPTNVESIDLMCMDCHEDEEEKFDGMLASWQTEVAELMGRAQAGADKQKLQLLEALRRAGPLHNIEATRTILNELAAQAPASQP